MATTTTNYELTKAGYNDIPDIQTINNNMDTLDSSLVVGESNDDVMETITKTTGWTNAEPVTLGDKFQSAMTKISTMIKNLKWIYKFIGSTDISSIGDGTITNAISTLSSNKLNASDVKTSLTDTSTSHALSTASGKALNDAIVNSTQVSTASVTTSISYLTVDFGYIRKVGKTASITCSITTSAQMNAWTQAGHIPDGFRPVNTVNVSGVVGSSGDAVRVQIAPNGIINFGKAMTANSTMYFSACYVCA